MVILNYTEKMKELDNLPTLSTKQREEQKRCLMEILEEAESEGFKGSYTIYPGSEDYVVDVYLNTEHEKLSKDGIAEFESFGYCHALIDYLQGLFNDEAKAYINYDNLEDFLHNE